MTVRVLPDSLIDQIAAGEVVERPASVVKELVENAMDAGADQIVVDVTDGGRTLISVIDNGRGMDRADLQKSIMRHATSKLPADDLLNINFMGFRGEALPSIASVSDMTIDTNRGEGLQLNCTTGEIRPSAWDGGTRIRVENLFAKTPARLKFLRGDRAEMMSVTEVVKRLAMSRPDIGFILNQKWIFPKGEALIERVQSVMGDEVRGRMLAVDTGAGDLRLHGFISEPTLRRASSIDQYLFVNGRSVKDKVLVGALRAAYMDVMHAREFPLCALYLELPNGFVDVNVSPSKTEVHFLEPARVRGFIIKTLRSVLAETLADYHHTQDFAPHMTLGGEPLAGGELTQRLFEGVREPERGTHYTGAQNFAPKAEDVPPPHSNQNNPLGRVIGQIGNKYILAEVPGALVIVDQHAAHERITYEKLRNHEIKKQPLLVPAVIKLKPEQVDAILEIADELAAAGLTVSQFGEGTVAIYEKPADWNMDWESVLRSVAEEVAGHGHSSNLQERLHLKLANYACHHSVRAGQRLDYSQMDALLRDVENTERAGQCNHGRPVYKIIPLAELDGWFERI